MTAEALNFLDRGSPLAMEERRRRERDNSLLGMLGMSEWNFSSIPVVGPALNAIGNAASWIWEAAKTAVKLFIGVAAGAALVYGLSRLFTSNAEGEIAPPEMRPTTVADPQQGFRLFRSLRDPNSALGRYVAGAQEGLTNFRERAGGYMRGLTTQAEEARLAQIREDILAEEARLAEVTEARIAAEARLTEINGRITDAETRLGTLTTEITDAEQLRASRMQAIADAEVELARLQANSATTAEDLEAARSRLAGLNGEAAEASALLEERRAELVRIQEETAQARTALTTELDNLDATRADYDEVRARIVAQQAELDRVAIATDAELARFDDAHAAAVAEEARLAEVTDARIAAESELTTIRGHITDAEARLDGLTDAADAAEARRATAMQAAAEAEIRVAALEASAGDATARLAELEAQGGVAEERLAELRREVTEATEALEAERTNLTRINQEALEAQQALEARQAELVDIRTQTIEAQERLTARLETLDGIEGDVSAARAELEAERARLDEVLRNTEAEQLRLTQLSEAAALEEARLAEITNARIAAEAEQRRLLGQIDVDGPPSLTQPFVDSSLPELPANADIRPAILDTPPLVLAEPGVLDTAPEVRTAPAEIRPVIVDDTPVVLEEPRVVEGPPDLRAPVIDERPVIPEIPRLATPFVEAGTGLPAAALLTAERPPLETTEARLAAIDGAGDTAAQIARAEGEVAALRRGGLAALGDELQNIMAAVKGSRLGSNVPVVGMGIGVGAGALTIYAFQVQRAYVEELYEAGEIDEEAYNAYRDLSGQNEAILLGDVALSTVDPTGLSVLVTVGVEGGVYGNFQDWMDRYAPTLDPQVANNLSMSLFTPDTMHTDITRQIMRGLHDVDSITDIPETLHAAYRAEERLGIAAQDFIASYTGENMDVQWELRRSGVIVFEAIGMPRDHLEQRRLAAVEAGNHDEAAAWQRFMDMREPLDQAQAAYRQEVSSLFQTRDGFGAALSLLSPDDRLDIIQRLYQSETREYAEQMEAAERLLDEAIMSSDFAGEEFDAQLRAYEEQLQTARDAFSTRMNELAANHPEVAAYMDEYHNSIVAWNWTMEHDDALFADPTRMNRYILERFGLTEPEAPEPTPAPADSLREHFVMSAAEITETINPVLRGFVPQGLQLRPVA